MNVSLPSLEGDRAVAPDGVVHVWDKLVDGTICGSQVEWWRFRLVNRDTLVTCVGCVARAPAD